MPIEYLERRDDCTVAIPQPIIVLKLIYSTPLSFPPDQRLHMQRSLHRFRVSKNARQTLEADPLVGVRPTTKLLLQTTEEARVGEDEHDTVSRAVRSACERCRRMKRKCSKTYPTCTLCSNGNFICSFADRIETPQESVRRLEAKIEWLTKQLNDARPTDLTSNTGQDSMTIPATILDAPSPFGSLLEELSVPRLVQPQMKPLDSNDYTADGLSTTSANNARGPGLSPSCCPNPPLIQFSENSEGGSAPGHTKSIPVTDAVKYAEAYFRHVHRSYPFMNEKNIMSMATSASIGDVAKINDRKCTKLYLVMAIGCTTLQRAGQVSAAVVEAFNISPAYVLQQCLSNDDIESLETLLLLGLYSLFEPSGIWPWKIVGFLARQVSILGLGRQTSEREESPILEKEMRSRLFWSVWNFDRLVSVTVGLSFGVQDKNINVALPSITVQEYSASDSSLFSLNIQINRHVIELRRLEEEIMERIHLINWHDAMSLAPAQTRNIIQQLETKVQNWYTHGCLLTTQERDDVPFHNTIAWLNMRHQNLLLLLYSPSHVNSSVSDFQFAQLKSCVLQCVDINAILFQNRHLPLNWVTICRLVAISATLSYCLVRHPVWTPTESLKVQKIANILEAFPESWVNVSRAITVFRSLASIFADTRNNLREDIVRSPLATLPVTSTSNPKHVVVHDIARLVRQVLGESSIYNKSVEAAIEIIGAASRVHEDYTQAQNTLPSLSNPSLSTDSTISWIANWEFSMDAL